jgi:hypothetical protein
MTKNGDLQRTEEIELKEERRLIKEYNYLNKLKQDILRKDFSDAHRIARKIESYELKLERFHNRVLDSIEILKEENLSKDTAEKLDKIENDIKLFRENLHEEISKKDGKIENLMTQNNWDELANYVIENLKEDIKIWIALDKKLIELEEELVK